MKRSDYDKLILIVDDDELLCQMLYDSLEEAGFRVATTANGKEALSFLERVIPDAIVCDLVMPEMDGLELCQEIRSNSLLSDLPIIMLTARTDLESTVNPFQVGADDYMTKPADNKELVARLLANIAKHETQLRLQNEARCSTVLLEIARSVTSTLDTQTILRQVVARVAESLEGVFRCSIIYIRNDSNYGYVVASSDDPNLSPLKIDLEKYPEIKQAIATRKPIVVEDVNSDPLLKLVRDRIDSKRFNSIIVLPVLFQTNVIGVMVVRAFNKAIRFMADEVKFCELVANVSANALQHARDLEEAHLETASLKKSQQQLEHELSIKAIYEMMFDGASEGLIAISQDLTILFVNRKAIELCGYTREELRHIDFSNLLEEPSRAEFIAVVRPSESSAIFAGVRLDATLNAGDGNKKQISISLGDRPRATGLQVLSFRDVTERRMMEADLKVARTELQEANERLIEMDLARTEFYNTAAHELRTPVSIINGYVELIEMSGKENLSAKQQEYLDLATQSCDRLIDLIGDMLDISRFDVDKMELSIRENDISDLIRDVCREIRGISDRKGLVLEASAGPLCMLNYDEFMIRRVLVNLIGNAVKFTPQGGRITIELADNEADVTISVIDNGPGIASDEISNLFKEFHSISQPSGPQGTGLGLSISKKIVEAHKGLIWAESELGSGSRFCFTLPRV